MAIHCCDDMRYHTENHCEQHEDRFTCPDSMILYNQKFDEYGIIVHDGTHSVITINFCPWCGKKLPESRRDQWFDELEAQGIDSRSDQIPNAYNDDTWWKNRN